MAVARPGLIRSRRDQREESRGHRVVLLGVRGLVGAGDCPPRRSWAIARILTSVSVWRRFARREVGENGEFGEIPPSRGRALRVPVVDAFPPRRFDPGARNVRPRVRAPTGSEAIGNVRVRGEDGTAPFGAAGASSEARGDRPRSRQIENESDCLVDELSMRVSCHPLQRSRMRCDTVLTMRP